MLATLDGLRAAGFTPAVMAPPEDRWPRAGGPRRRVVPFQCRAADGTRCRRAGCARNWPKCFVVGVPLCCTPTAWRWDDFRARWPPNCGLPSIAHLRDIVRLSAQAVADLNCHRRCWPCRRPRANSTWPAESTPKRRTCSTTASISTSSAPDRRRATFTENSAFRPTPN